MQIEGSLVSNDMYVETYNKYQQQKHQTFVYYKETFKKLKTVLVTFISFTRFN